MKTLYNFHKNVYSSELFKDQKGLAEFHCTVQLPYNKPERLLDSPVLTEEFPMLLRLLITASHWGKQHSHFNFVHLLKRSHPTMCLCTLNHSLHTLSASLLPVGGIQLGTVLIYYKYSKDLVK